MESGDAVPTTLITQEIARLQNNVVLQALQEFNNCLAGIELPSLDDLVLDGEIQRIGPNQKGWYALEDDGHAIYGSFGNWAEKEDGVSWPYFEFQYSNGEDLQAAKERRQASTKAKQEMQRLAHEQARDMAEAEFNSAGEVSNHPYLTRKGIKHYGLLKLGTNKELLVPFRSPDKTLQTLQRITVAGDKFFFDGAAKQGYFKIPGNRGTLYLAEGLATCMSIREATGNYTVMAGDKGCMFLVARTLRTALPKQKIVIAADTDALESLTPLAQEIGAEIVSPKGINGSDFNDLHQEKGLAEVKKQLSGSQPPEIIVPEPLRRQALSSNPFPVEALGPVLSPAAIRIQQIIQAPLAMCGQSVLAGAAQAIQGQLDIVIDGRRRPSSEFFVSVGGTGERKSAVDEAALRPHYLYERELKEEFGLDMEVYENDLACWKAERKEIMTSTDREAKRKALDELGSEPEKPLLPHLFSGDPTVPGITKLLNLGRASIGIFSDEGGLMIGGYSFAKEQAINTGAALSRLWDGRPIDRIRGGDDIIKLYDRRVSFHLMIQPKIAGEFLRHEGLSDQGFLTRCLASYPASTVGKRPYQEISLDDPVLLTYQSRLLDILKTPLALREDQRQELDPACVSLDAQAKELWIEFHDYCDSQSSKDGEFDPIKGFANKAPEHALRLATILSGVSDLSNREINLDTIEKAITLTQYYLSEWLRIADEAGIDPDITLAEKLCIWLECRTDDLISAPNIYQSGPYALRNKNDTMRIMRILEGHGYVIKQPAGTKVEGKPRKDVWRVVR